jgi:hypothetical protein
MRLSKLLLRWTARLSAVIVAGAYAVLMIGEMATPHSGAPSTVLEWTGIALLTIAAGALLLVWKWELEAGLVSLAAVALHALMIPGSPQYHRALMVMATPGVLCCLDWFAQRAVFAREQPGI